jgi:hypothetical protein
VRACDRGIVARDDPEGNEERKRSPARALASTAPVQKYVRIVVAFAG